MSSHNTTSSSIVNDVLANLRPGTVLPIVETAGAVVRPAASSKANETIVSIHPVPTETGSESPRISPQPHNVIAHDDADVQEYMNRLLKRSGAPQTSAAAIPEPTVPAPEPIAPEVVPVEKVWEAKDFIPKSVAPEKKANLTALREVANESQRSAIETSVKQKLQVESSKYWALLGATIAFGFLFLFMSSKWFDTAMLFGIVSLVFSIPLAWQARRVSARKSKKQS
jgi:hypothetical protein